MLFTELIFGILASPQFAAFIFTALVAVATWVARQIVALIKRQLTAQQIETLFKVAAIAVTFAEQTGADKTGAEKKAEALRVAQTYLNAYNIKVTATQLNAAIEAAVFSEITKLEPPPPPNEPPVLPSVEALGFPNFPPISNG